MILSTESKHNFALVGCIVRTCRIEFKPPTTCVMVLIGEKIRRDTDTLLFEIVQLFEYL